MIWDETLWDKEIFTATKDLIKLRKERVAFRRGDFQTALASQNGVYGYWRSYKKERMLVLFNNQDTMEHVSLLLSPEKQGIWRQVYPVISEGINFNDHFQLTLPPWSGMIWEFQG